MRTLFNLFREMGGAGYLLLMLGVLAFGVAVLAMAIAIFRPSLALIPAFCALALGMACAGGGQAATALGRSVMRSAIEGVAPNQTQMIIREGEREARVSSAFGAAIALPPLALGLLAGIIAARARRRTVVVENPTPDGMYRGTPPRVATRGGQAAYYVIALAALGGVFVAWDAATYLAPLPPGPDPLDLHDRE